ncbi:RNA polymerase sigma-70 factor, ECF subfamily [Chitinophaga sp. CF118]|uniref:RNA polymerase sigma factor n=1 Tax=Chitinophaga sp. CF118 TaxID=1884367 RepID=UPI0008E6BF43|nr:RNA polymerase sigma-70 factor [Chitinophaga sp. CF118]SFF06907.1 RNA polymerase sigma-70 factor, ECF subfamily [Chitinophaga sp. CF118]
MRANNYSLYSDAQLADMINMQDISAFEEIYRRYWSLLFIHANKMLEDELQAEDVVQELFTKLLAQMGQLNYKSTISAFLYKSTRNIVLDLIRHRKVKTNYITSIKEHFKRGECTTDNRMRENELKRQIEKEIGSLPPKMRIIFEMSRKTHLTHKEIATTVNVAEGTVKKQIYYAIKVLRSKLTCILCLQIMSTILGFNRIF